MHHLGITYEARHRDYSAGSDAMYALDQRRRYSKGVTTLAGFGRILFRQSVLKEVRHAVQIRIWRISLCFLLS